MKLQLDQAVSVLERTPSAIDAMLRGLPEPWIRGDEGQGTWSPFVVVGHLIHGEKTDWIPRARILLEHGEARAFDKFDRFAQLRDSKDKTLDALLDEFRAARETSLAALRDLRLTPADLERRGRHPELGGVTLGQLLATWVVHDLGHVRQIARAMAKQYAGEVGAWKAYLRILSE